MHKLQRPAVMRPARAIDPPLVPASVSSPWRRREWEGQQRRRGEKMGWGRRKRRLDEPQKMLVLPPDVKLTLRLAERAVQD